MINTNWKPPYLPHTDGYRDLQNVVIIFSIANAPGHVMLFLPVTALAVESRGTEVLFSRRSTWDGFDLGGFCIESN